MRTRGILFSPKSPVARCSVRRPRATLVHNGSVLEGMAEGQ